MGAWWQSLSTLEHILLYIAVPATLVLLVQTLLLLIGGGGEGGDLDGGGELDLDGDGIPDGLLPDPDGCGDPLSHWDGDLDGDLDGEAGDMPGQGLHILTVRGVVTFLTLFGWGALWLCQTGKPQWLAVFLAVPIGLAGMIGVAVLLQQALRLQYDGTLDLRNAVGCTGLVYLTIPPNRSGPGKVSVTVQEQLREFEACADSERPIPTGRPVRIIGLLEGNTLLVEEVEA